MSEWGTRRIKVLLCRVLQCVGPVNTLTAEGCSETRPTMHLSIYFFRSKKIRKYLSYEAQTFFQNVTNVM